MAYQDENEAKAVFDAIYDAPTPHEYLDRMCRLGYQIGEQARPYCLAAAELLRDRNGEAWPVQLLDLGCSYGIVSAFVKYRCSFEEMVAFYHARAPRDYAACAAATRNWLNAVPPRDMRVVGLDPAQNAIRFAIDSGMLDGGIDTNFEETDVAVTDDDLAWIRGCNLIPSTGAIGYVTERTLDTILPHVGEDHPGGFGPVAVITILRMFDETPVAASFQRAGWDFREVPNTRLPQRSFADDEEKNEVVKLVRERGHETKGWEEEGILYADLYVAGKNDSLDPLLGKIEDVTRDKRDEETLFASHTQVAIAGSATATHS